MTLNIKMTDKKAVTYSDHVIPTVNIPADIKKCMTADEQKRLELACLDDYVSAKKALDESIADVTSTHQKALAFAGELAARVLILMDIAVHLGLDSRVSTEQVDKNKLKQVGVDHNAIEARALGFLKEIKKGVLKRIVMSDCGAIEKGNVTEAGFVGMNSLAIQHAAEGNLRERMYIPYKSTWAFTENLLSNKNNVDLINHELTKMGCAWQLNAEAIDELQSLHVDKRLYQLGAYAASREGSRTSHSEEYQRRYQENNPSIQDMNFRRVPLSLRESLAQSGDLSTKSEKKIQWLPGEAWYGVEVLSELHPGLKAANESRDLMLTGVSGTTDSIFTMSHVLGLFNGANKEQKMQDCMMACMGWMIDARDHTAHEIQTSAKSFGLDYTPGPDSYKQIRPGDKGFEHDLRAAQKKRGYEMPDDVLREAHIRQKAHELFPELSKRKIRDMKKDVRAVKDAMQHPSEKKTPLF